MEDAVDEPISSKGRDCPLKVKRKVISEVLNGDEGLMSDSKVEKLTLAEGVPFNINYTISWAGN